MGGSAILLASTPADYSLDIAPCSLQLSPKSTIKTLGYNGKVPGPLMRLRAGRPVTIEVTNGADHPEIVHWHGLFSPSDVDGSMEEGTPMIPAGGNARYTFTPRPAGFRWYHTHIFAGHDFRKGQYNGLHGFIFVDSGDDPGRYDAEIFLALHDWKPDLLASDDGSMNPTYEVSTINGRVLGFGEPLRVRENQRVLLQILNSSPTEVHWLALAGHQFEVVALDGNAVPSPRAVPMLRLAPAERVSAIVRMNNPGKWILGEVRRHIQAAGMGMVIEYAGQSGPPRWQQPETLTWDYAQFGAGATVAPDNAVVEIPLVFKSKFAGHGAMDRWMINGKSFPKTDSPVLESGKRYRLVMKNESTDNHPVHLHRHVFELRRLSDGRPTRGVVKDTILVDANTEAHVEFTADNPGLTLFHCHQQDHMDMGFMMLFRYA